MSSYIRSIQTPASPAPRTVQPTMSNHVTRNATRQAYATHNRSPLPAVNARTQIIAPAMVCPLSSCINTNSSNGRQSYTAHHAGPQGRASNAPPTRTPRHPPAIVQPSHDSIHITNHTTSGGRMRQSYTTTNEAPSIPSTNVTSEAPSIPSTNASPSFVFRMHQGNDADEDNPPAFVLPSIFSFYPYNMGSQN